MAHLTPLWTDAPVTDAAAIARFLELRGITFETWDIPAAAQALAAKARLSDTEKSQLLAQFAEVLASKADDAGYKSADVIAIRADLPGLDTALAKFDKVHYHDDDEVRAIVGGAGIFGFIGDDGRQFLLKVEAGEYISVPAGTWHWFYCDAARNITALRLFREGAGWEAHYRDTARGGAAA
ncbi:MAG: 1,2-dihydroxy-3-keto-5-methylthiopentene dioxygenase [Myxococcota bacterium]|jgi:1,2-dihydroxy-3-keto-5-methylthiopentene dioxygenase